MKKDTSKSCYFEGSVFVLVVRLVIGQDSSQLFDSAHSVCFSVWPVWQLPSNFGLLLSAVFEVCKSLRPILK